LVPALTPAGTLALPTSGIVKWRDMETMDPVTCEFSCADCGAVFSFEAAPGEAERSPRILCPLCGLGDAGFVRSRRPGDSGLTGTYKFSRALDRMIKISDRTSGKSCCGGSGCGSGCGGGCCGR
jgi:hypothetical protein